MILDKRKRYIMEVCQGSLREEVPRYPIISLYRIARGMAKDGDDLGENKFRNIIYKYEKKGGITPTRKPVRNVTKGMLFFDPNQATYIFNSLSKDGVIDSGKYSDEKLKKELEKMKKLILSGDFFLNVF